MPSLYFWWEEPMKRLSMPAILLLGVTACAPQPAPPLVAAASPPGQGPSKNLGLNYDGTYVGVSVVNNSAGNTWTSGGSQPCVTEPAPTLVISRGRAQFPWQGYMLTGNVTPRWCIAAAAARPWMLSAQPLLRG